MILWTKATDSVVVIFIFQLPAISLRRIAITPLIILRDAILPANEKTVNEPKRKPSGESAPSGDICTLPSREYLLVTVKNYITLLWSSCLQNAVIIFVRHESWHQPILPGKSSQGTQCRWCRMPQDPGQAGSGSYVMIRHNKKPHPPEIK